VPYDISTNNTLGIIIKKDSFKTSISIPFNYNYQEYGNPFQYDEDTKKGTYIQYSNTYFTGITGIFDIKVNDIISFKIPVEFDLQITDLTLHYHFKDTIRGINVDDNDDFNLIKYSIPN
jgi:hypothetical protein